VLLAVFGSVLWDCTFCRSGGMAGWGHPMSLALITAFHHGGSSHFTGPWYIAVPLIAVAIGLAILRSRRGGGGRGLFGGSDDQ
jgi:hypothetical protein